MAAGQGSIIEYSDYNAIQKIISAILGTGGSNPYTNGSDSTYGYGQPVSSSQVAQYAKVSVAQWNNLRNDLLYARQHQSGADESGNLALPTLDTKIAEADRSAYLSFANVINTNRLTTPPSSQSSFSTVSTATRTVYWNGTISHTFTANFDGYTLRGTTVSPTDHMRVFFNTGGNFKFSASLTEYTLDGSRLVNESWDTLMKNMGVITFNINSTSMTGSGSPATNIGFSQLTTSNQLIFSKLVEAGNQYTPNQYDLYARISGSSVIFTPTWTYSDAGNDGPNRVFEQVKGTLTSICQMTIATGNNVSIASPRMVVTGSNFNSTNAVLSPVYNINPSSSSVNEGSTLAINVTGTNIVNGTYYWSINHTSTANADFSATSGSFTITNNSGTFNIVTIADSTTEGAELFTVTLRSDSITGTPLATTSTITINDTSTTPVVTPTYTLTAASSSVNEGSSLLFTVGGTNIPNGTYYWTVNNGTSSNSDFSSVSGSISVANNAGSFSVTPIADSTTEGSETFTASLRSGSIGGSVLATSATITINDTSTTPSGPAPANPTYSLSPAPGANLSEGGTTTFTLTTTDVANGTYYWTIVNNTTSNADFSATSGSFSLSSGTGSFSISPVADHTAEGTETFVIYIRSGSTVGTILASFGVYNVSDTSTTYTETFTISPAYPVVRQPFNIILANGAPNTGFTYTISANGSGTLDGSGTATFSGITVTQVQALVYNTTFAATGHTLGVYANIGPDERFINSSSPQRNVAYNMTVDGGVPSGSFTYTGSGPYPGGSGTLDNNGQFTFTGLTFASSGTYSFVFTFPAWTNWAQRQRTYTVTV